MNVFCMLHSICTTNKQQRRNKNYNTTCESTMKIMKLLQHMRAGQNEDYDTITTCSGTMKIMIQLQHVAA